MKKPLIFLTTSKKETKYAEQEILTYFKADISSILVIYEKDMHHNATLTKPGSYIPLTLVSSVAELTSRFTTDTAFTLLLVPEALSSGTWWAVVEDFWCCCSSDFTTNCVSVLSFSLVECSVLLLLFVSDNDEGDSNTEDFESLLEIEKPLLIPKGEPTRRNKVTTKFVMYTIVTQQTKELLKAW